MTRRSRLAGAIAAAILTLGAITAQAQWVMVARAVAGRVEQMSNRGKDGNGYDVATVVLEAAADKVYQTALANLKTHQDVTITRQDAKAHLIEFGNGKDVASLKATPLSEKITQLMIASTVSGDQPGSSSMVAQAVLRVCKEMNVECTLAGQ